MHALAQHIPIARCPRIAGWLRKVVRVYATTAQAQALPYRQQQDKKTFLKKRRKEKTRLLMASAVAARCLQHLVTIHHHAIRVPFYFCIMSWTNSLSVKVGQSGSVFSTV